jgi:hypothetical protein
MLARSSGVILELSQRELLMVSTRNEVWKISSRRCHTQRLMEMVDVVMVSTVVLPVLRVKNRYSNTHHVQWSSQYMYQIPGNVGEQRKRSEMITITETMKKRGRR